MERGAPLSHYQLPKSNSGNQIISSYLCIYVPALCILTNQKLVFEIFCISNKELENFMSS